MKTILNKCGLLILFLLGVQQADGQFRLNYTTSDGLPSNEVYDVQEDRNGFMWFATDAGVSRFNGQTFENFTKDDGLIDNVVFEIVVDEEGALWFAGMNNLLCSFNNERFTPYRFNDSLKIHLKNENVFIGELFIKNNAVALAFTNSRKAISVDVNGNIAQFNHPNEENTWLRVLWDDGVTPAECYGNYRGIIQRDSVEIRIVDVFTGKILFASPKRSLNNLSAPDLGVWRSNGITYTSLFKNEFSAIDIEKGEKINLEFESLAKYGVPISATPIDENRVLFILQANGVLVAEKKSDNFIIKEHFLSEVQANKGYVDHRGGIWICTYKHGVYYSQNVGLENWNIQPGMGVLAMDLSPNKNDLLVFWDKPSLTLLNRNLGNSQPWRKNDNLFTIESFGAFLNEDEIILRLAEDFYVITKENNQQKRVNRSGFHARPNSHVLFKNTLYWTQRQRVGYAYLNENNEIVDVRADVKLINTLYTNDTILYLGTQQGLYKTSKPRDHTAAQKISNMPFDVRALASVSGKLLIGTKNKGLWYLTGDELTRIETHGFLSKEITAIQAQGDTIYIGSDQGLAVFRFLNQELQSIGYLGEEHGLMSNDITALRSSPEGLWIGNKFGLAFWPRSEAIPTFNKPNLVFQSLRTATEEIAVEGDMPIQLDYGAGPIRLRYRGIDPYQKQQFEYKYRWDNGAKEFVTTATELVIPRIEHGESAFFVSAKNVSGMWSDEKRLKLSVAAPFWLNPIFVIVTGLCCLALFVFFSWWRENQVREEIETQNRIAELRAKAIRAQMNPHFIFNSLNSIQRFIVKNDTKNSLDYLGKFADLVRGVLDSSDSTTISIEREIQNVEAYLEIEKMRFDNRFDFTIEVHSNVNQSWAIPAMLIQPYAENSVWHGLQSIANQGHILIEFKRDKSILEVTITDNGIGRANAIQNSEKSKRSVGMTLTEERLKLVDEKGQVFVEDLYDTDGPCGTKVVLRIPIEE